MGTKELVRVFLDWLLSGVQLISGSLLGLGSPLSSPGLCADPAGALPPRDYGSRGNPSLAGLLGFQLLCTAGVLQRE